MEKNDANSKQLAQAPNPLNQRQTLVWYVALTVSSMGTYIVMREGGADFKEPFIISVYLVWIGLAAWLLRKYILSEVKDRER